MKYRKKPVEVDAVQFTDETKDRVRNSLECVEPDFEEGNPVLKVRTIHGDVAVVRLGDWIISEEKLGRYYPCKPDVFEVTYEKV